MRNNLENTRLKLPIDMIFDTGLNITVLGEAGAGKSTCMQMYTQKKLNSEIKKIFIYAPLSRIIQNWTSKEPEVYDEIKAGNFEHGLALYLTHIGIPITFSELILEFNTKGGILLLDGIDEAIKLAPWLLSGIKHLSIKYENNVQIIVSSRVSGNYLDKIPFFAVTLLPFSDEQRNEFINKWFNSDRANISSIQNHLKKNKSISIIVDNPLLTTMLCVLAENDIALPKSELNMYEQRFRLLLGYYDIAKNINRLKTNIYILHRLSQKIAFYLHNKALREEDRIILYDVAFELMPDDLKHENASIAIEELIDPCNVLIPMTEDGKVGFGHLRFQEYLAAVEINSNREIDIISLMNQTWWEGTILLYSQMNNSLEKFFENIILLNSQFSIQEILKKIIETRSVTEQRTLQNILKKSKKEIKYESKIKNFNGY